MRKPQWVAVLFHVVVVVGSVFILQTLNAHDRAVVTNFISQWSGRVMLALLTVMLVRGFLVYRRAVHSARTSSTD